MSAETVYKLVDATGQQPKTTEQVHNRMASEKQNLPFGEAKSEPRPQTNRGAKD